MATAIITGNLREILGTAYTDPFWLFNASAPLVDGTAYVVGTPEQVTPSASGDFTVNLYPGNYRLTIPGQKAVATFVVPADGGTYNLAELLDATPFTGTAPNAVPIATDTVYGKVILDRATGTAATTAYVNDRLPDNTSLKWVEAERTLYVKNSGTWETLLAV